MGIKKLVLVGILCCLVVMGMTGCEYVQAESDEDGTSFPLVRVVINEAERLDMDPGEYADRLYRGRRADVEESYDRRFGNASGSRLERLERRMERDLNDLEFNYEELCDSLERRDYTCEGTDDGG